MKKIRILLIIGLIAVAWTQSYAIIDIGAYGGYSFSGNLDAGVKNVTLGGPEYGFIAHFNSTVIPIILSVGMGPYYQSSMLKYTLDGSHDFNRKTLGIDFYAQLELPIIIHPFVRVAPTIWEEADSKKQYFNGYLFGGGIAVTIFPMLQIYGEYLYNRAWVMKAGDTTGHAVHLGLRLNI